MDKRPLLLLTVPGRRSGALYTVPVVYFDHSGRYLVVGTGMGGSKRTFAVVSESPGCRQGPNPYPGAGARLGRRVVPTSRSATDAVSRGSLPYSSVRMRVVNRQSLAVLIARSVGAEGFLFLSWPIDSTAAG